MYFSRPSQKLASPWDDGTQSYGNSFLGFKTNPCCTLWQRLILKIPFFTALIGAHVPTKNPRLSNPEAPPDTGSKDWLQELLDSFREQDEQITPHTIHPNYTQAPQDIQAEEG